MARFDVYRRERKPGFLLDCQSDLLDEFETRLVVPLLPAERAKRATRLHPLLEVEGAKYIMVTQLAAAVPKRFLGQPVASLADEHDTIMNALDMLLTGY